MFIRESTYGPVKSFEVARTYAGRPLWTTRVYLTDKFMIDTAAPNATGAILEIARAHRPDAVLLTHHHEDHSGNAGVLKNELGLPVLASSATAKALERPFYTALFQRVVWGKPSPEKVDVLEEEISLGSFTLRAVPAPGHSHDMTVYLEPHRGWLFSGDLYLSSRIKYFREDEDFAQTMHSLERVLKLDFDSLFCGHNPKPENGKKFLQQKLDYFRELEGTVAELSMKGYPPNEVTRQILGKEGLMPFLTSGRVARKHLVNSILVAGSSQKR